MAMKSKPTAQPKSALEMRARKNVNAFFISGSLVATMELIAQIGFLGHLMHAYPENRGSDEDTHGVMDSVHVALNVLIGSLIFQLRQALALRIHHGHGEI